MSADNRVKNGWRSWSPVMTGLPPPLGKPSNRPQSTASQLADVSGTDARHPPIVHSYSGNRAVSIVSPPGAFIVHSEGSASVALRERIEGFPSRAAAIIIKSTLVSIRFLRRRGPASLHCWLESSDNDSK